MLDDLQKVPNLTPGKFVAKRFPNEELHIKLETKIKNKPCLILGSIVPPEANLFSFLLLAHTLKKENAQQIITLLPYLAYSRHDKQEPQKSYATALIGNLLQTSGIAEVITVDVHNPQTKRLFPIPLISLSPAQIFAEKIKKLQLQNVTLVAPDEGAILRTQAVAKKLNYQDKITFMIKTRTETGLTHSEIHGKISKQVIIIDDMLDTGTTLISCCKKLKENGAEEIYIIVTHGLFTGDNWQKL
ncbi:MAG TPA: ribose-phosphate diphosphokinase, partial [Patescibacteria group bacterium]